MLDILEEMRDMVEELAADFQELKEKLQILTK